MPEIPEGAKTPTDHQPPQSSSVKPPERPEGWELLREPIDAEFWEVADFTSAIANIKTNGERVELNAKNLKTVGDVAKQLQTVFAKNSEEFRTWARQGGFEAATPKLVNLAFAYANALGEADSSGS
jgi:hypothetical protein